MGTTMTAALVAGERIAIGHVGDSRAYRIRNGTIEQLTDDHSLVADLVRSGRLSPEEAESHPQRSVITRALGTDAAVSIDSFTVEAQDGDVFLLCSDGLTTMVDEEAMLRILAEAPDLGAAARQLIAAANRGGGEDNVTVVLFALEEGDPADEDTFTDLVLPVAPSPAELAPAVDHAVSIPRRSRVGARGHGRASRVALLVAMVLLLFAGLAGLALWGLSRAHFVGADSSGHVVVYQGVPWNAFGGLELYREIYVSPLLAVQLSPEERAKLFDHSLVSEEEARSRIAPYEEEAAP
jgi:protein phosphatase